MHGYCDEPHDWISNEYIETYHSYENTLLQGGSNARSNNFCGIPE